MKSSTTNAIGVYYQTHLNTGVVEIKTRPNWIVKSFYVNGFGPSNFVLPSGGFFFRDTTTDWFGMYQVNGGNDPSKYEGNCVYPGYVRSPPTETYAGVHNQALSRLHDQLRSNVDLSIDLAQAGQTVKMMRDIGKAVRTIRSIHPNQWAKRWLENQYGIRPLLSTIYGTLDNLMSPARDGFVTLHGRGTTVDQGTKAGNGPGPGAIDAYTHSVRAEIGCTYDLTKPSALQSIANYTSLNPASIAWELTPFSFVADWFYDLGGYLRNLETAYLYMNNVRACYRTYTRLYTINSVCRGTVGGTNFNLRASYEYIYKSRASLPYPLPVKPRFEAKLGWQRVVSAAALLKEVFLSRR